MKKYFSGENTKERCIWVTEEPLYIAYHDVEWGVPVYDERLLFEFLVLEGMQAGLSWLTILKKRENYRASFDGFDAKCIACYGKREINQRLLNPGIIRNRLKVESIVKNARAFLKLKEQTCFTDYLWNFVGGKPIKNHWQGPKQVPTSSSISDKMSKDLKNRGFNFVGTTICYAFMQAVGMVNDHTVNCFCYKKSWR